MEATAGRGYRRRIKARREHDKRRSAIERRVKEWGSSGSLEGGHVFEVGEESRIRVGEWKQWRQRVMRSGGF